MRRFGFSMLAVIMAGLLGVAGAQAFSGTFVATGGEMSIVIQHGQDGSLTGIIAGETGQYQFQGQADGLAAYGAAESKQGLLGFQAELSADGQTLQMMFYQSDANNQPAPVSPVIVLQRQAGVGVGSAGSMPPQPPGGMPGQMPGQVPGGMPGQMPGGVPGQVPGGMPGQMPGGMPGQVPGGMPGQTPGGMPGQMPGGVPGQSPGGMFGTTPPTTPNPAFGALPDWNGTFVGNAGATALVVQGSQGAYTGYIHDQGAQYQFQAHLDDATLHGEMMANGNPYEFWADRDGSTVYLYVGSNTYVLEFAGTP